MTVKKYEKIEFKTLNGLTFVFLKETITINTHLASSQIRGCGIIYVENNDYYFAPFDEDYDLKLIVKEYVKYSRKRNVLTFNNNINNQRSG